MQTTESDTQKSTQNSTQNSTRGTSPDVTRDGGLKFYIDEFLAAQESIEGQTVCSTHSAEVRVMVSCFWRVVAESVELNLRLAEHHIARELGP